MAEEPIPKRNRWVVVLLVLLPFWLVVSSGIGLWMWYRGQQKAEQHEPAKFATPISEEVLADDLRKLVEVVGPRGLWGEGSRRGLTRAAAMIEGALGAGNAGYRVERFEGPKTPFGTWPVIVVTLPGMLKDLPPVAVVTGYDTLPGTRGEEFNSTGVASLLSVASTMAGENKGRPVKFVFLPHVYEEEAPVAEVMGMVGELAGGASPLLVVEATGAGEELMLSSRDLAMLEKYPFETVGKIVGAETVCLAEDFDVASTLFEMGMPAVRVSTRVSTGIGTEELPDALNHAEATRKLAEVVGMASR